MGSDVEVAALSVEEVDRLRVTPGVQLVDVRPPFDYFSGRVPAALNLPASSVIGRMGQIPADRKLILICDDGVKSLEVAKQAREAGYTDVSILDGGYDAWLAADLPTETISDGITPTMAS